MLTSISNQSGGRSYSLSPSTPTPSHAPRGRPGRGGSGEGSPARTRRDSPELVVRILQFKSANPSRSARCLRSKTPSPHSLRAGRGRGTPWGTRVSPERRVGWESNGNQTSPSFRFGHLVWALLSSDILNKYKESLALLSSIRLHDGVEPSDFHQSSIK